MKYVHVHIRRMIYSLIYHFDHLMRRKTEVIILSYHSFARNRWRYSVDPEEFDKQLAYLKSAGYSFISLSDLQKLIEKKRMPKVPSVVITVDDGYESVVNITSIIAKHDVPVSLFLMGDKNSLNRKEMSTHENLLTNQQIRSLIDKKWDIGSHSNSHADLSTCNADSITREISDSKKTLEQIFSVPIMAFAYPRGRYDKRVIAAVQKAGYALGLTMDDSIITAKTNPYILPRIGVNRTHSLSEFNTLFSPSVILFRKYVKKTFLRRYYE